MDDLIYEIFEYLDNSTIYTLYYNNIVSFDYLLKRFTHNSILKHGIDFEGKNNTNLNIVIQTDAVRYLRSIIDKIDIINAVFVSIDHLAEKCISELVQSEELVKYISNVVNADKILMRVAKTKKKRKRHDARYNIAKIILNCQGIDPTYGDAKSLCWAYKHQNTPVVDAFISDGRAEVNSKCYRHEWCRPPPIRRNTYYDNTTTGVHWSLAAIGTGNNYVPGGVGF